jgi:hypothetical protein
MGWLDKLVAEMGASEPPAQPMARAMPPAFLAPEDPQGQAREIVCRVQERGRCLLWSEVLEDYIAFARDEEAAAQVPPGYVIYTLRELEELFEMGAKPLSGEMLRAVHNTKKVFEGSRIVPKGVP